MTGLLILNTSRFLCLWKKLKIFTSLNKNIFTKWSTKRLVNKTNTHPHHFWHTQWQESCGLQQIGRNASHRPHPNTGCRGHCRGNSGKSASSEQKPNRTGAHGKHSEGAQPSSHRLEAQACRARPRRSGLTHIENQRFPFPEQGTQGGDKRWLS